MLTVAILQNIEGVHVGLLRQVTGKNDQRLEDDTWKKEGADRVIQLEGTKPPQ